MVDIAYKQSCKTVNSKLCSRYKRTDSHKTRCNAESTHGRIERASQMKRATVLKMNVGVEIKCIYLLVIRMYASAIVSVRTRGHYTSGSSSARVFSK